MLTERGFAHGGGGICENGGEADAVEAGGFW